MPETAIILAPRGRDGPLAQAILGEAGLRSDIATSFEALLKRLQADAGFAIITEEALAEIDPAPLHNWRLAQPQWSDFPFILLTARGGVERNPAASRYLDLFGNVTFLERPFHPTSLVALAKSALRSRRKQYDARSRLEALYRSEERFRAAVEAVQGVLWTNSADGRMEGEQDAWAALTGQSFEAYQGYGWAEAVHPEDAQPTIDAWNLAVENKSLFAFEHRVRRRDGHWRSFSIRAIPTFTTDGRLREWVGIHTDVTEQRAAEAALLDLNATLEERVETAIAGRKVLADIFEITDSFVQVADFDFCWLAINRAASDEFHRIFGRRPRIGQSMLDLLADLPESQAAVKSVWQRALSGEEFTQIETYGEPNLQRRTYEMKFNTLRDGRGTPIGAFQVVTDVTRRIEDAARLAETQDALRQAQKMEAIGQLTGGVAHDFNNLLTIISGGVDILRSRDDVPAERRRRYLDAIHDAAERAARLTQQLLAFSRRQPLRPTVFDVGQRVTATADMLRSILGSRIALTVSCDDGLRVNADAPQFETALVNLSLNGRDAMAGEGPLSIRANAVQSEVHIHIEDKGHGIDPTILPRLFEPFFTTKDVGKGTGLGLSQVYGFAQQSGGDIRVESRPGGGTRFTLVLPRTERPVADVADAPTQIARASMRILVVEDNDELRAFASSLLGEMGHSVEAAASGAEALAALDAAPDRFELMFTDVVMPGMSGLELARNVRRSWPKIKVILASGYSDALANAEGMEFPLVSKPYGAAQLTAVLYR